MAKPRSAGGIKRLFWDIEVTPNLVWSWRVGYNINLQHENIVEERKVICIAYKWEGEHEVTCIRWDRDHDDRTMLADFLRIANSADELVAQYGDGFDMPWFRTRCLIHGLEPLPQYKTIDTKAWAAKNFYFNSNKLDYLGKILGFGGKDDTDFDLWLRVMKGEKAALDYMVKYCKKDVVRLEQVYSKLSKCMKPDTHVGVLNGGEKWTCPHCGSRNVELHKRRVSGKGSVSYQFQCQDCGGYYTVSEATYKNFMKCANQRMK